MNPVPRLTRSERTAFACAAVSGLVHAAASAVFKNDSTGAWSWMRTLRLGYARTGAVRPLPTKEYTDDQIGDMLQTSPGAVRSWRYRFRTVLYEATREGRIWIPAHLHVAGGTTIAVWGGAA